MACFCCCDCSAEGAAPVASFSFAPSEDGPCCFDFTDTTTPGTCGAIERWDWDFGDGSHSTAQNPTHCYQGSGSGPFTVTLEVRDAGGCRDTATDEVACCDCDAEGASPTADFTFQQTSYAPCCVDFTDTSVAGTCGPITEWLWYFGDGATSTDQNPSHCYASNGPWDVTLTVTDENGCFDSAVMEVECKPLDCNNAACAGACAVKPSTITVEIDAGSNTSACYGLNGTWVLADADPEFGTCAYVYGPVTIPTGDGTTFVTVKLYATIICSREHIGDPLTPYVKFDVLQSPGYTQRLISICGPILAFDGDCVGATGVACHPADVCDIEETINACDPSHLGFSLCATFTLD